jgi:hypothetical protein
MTRWIDISVMRLYCAASPPGALLIDQGVRIDWPLGEA